MASINIEVQSKQVIKRLDELEKYTGNVTPAMQVIGRKVLTRVQLGFKSSNDPWGKAWDKLKHRKGQPLKDTGRMLQSMTYRVGTGNDQHVDIGTNLQSKGVNYPAVHQYGAIIQIPARSQSIYRQLLSSGALAKKGKFVKKEKSNFASNVTLPAYSITIPARPFLPIRSHDVDLPQEWQLDVLNALEAHFKKALRA